MSKNTRKIGKRTITMLLTAVILLAAVFMAGCTRQSEPPNNTPSEVDTPAGSDTPVDAPSVLTLPILDEIDQTVTIGTSGSSLSAVQAAVKLLDWGVNTGLGADEIGGAASAWMETNGDDCLRKLELVDDAYQRLLTDEARELLDSAGCADAEITWGSEPVEAVEAIMQAAGLRG